MERKKTSAKQVFIVIIAVLLALIIAFGCAFLILRYIGKKQFHKGDTDISEISVADLEIDENTVSFAGKDYVLNEDIITVLFMGIDKKSINTDLGVGQNGQADSIFLAAINTSNKSVKIIPISRETMVEINLFTPEGHSAGIEKKQLCLAYAYGDTPEKCSLNVLNSVRRILYGININSYVTVDLKGVGVVTEKVGGVRLSAIEAVRVGGKTVNIGDELLLKGESAINYIRDRGDDVEANNRRMLRQKQFLSAFASTAGNQILDDFSKLTTYYNSLSPYLSTNLSFAQITYLASSCLTRNIGSSLQYIQITGETVKGEKWIEFIPDREALLTTVLQTFYKEK